MNHRVNHDQRNTQWLLSAMLVPAIQTASKNNWTVTAVAAVVCLAAGGLAAEKIPPAGSWLEVLQSLWLCVVISELLHWCDGVWPGHEKSRAAPLMILALCLWLTRGKGTQTARAGCVLLWPVVLMLGAVLLAALPEAKAKNLEPDFYLEESWLLTILLLFPLSMKQIRKRRGKVMWIVLAAATLASVVSAGVLSAGICAREPVPIYELSRSISLFGIAERFESLTAASMTLGWFVSISYLLEQTKGKMLANRTWIPAGIAGVLFLSNIRVKGEISFAAVLILWVVLPMLTGNKNKSEN